MKPASFGLPLCFEHAMNIWTEVERRGMGTDHARYGPTQYAGSPGHPVVYYVVIKPDIVKIGTTSDLVGRVQQLRLDMDQVLAAEPGGFPKEKHRHDQFAHLRIGRREDFRLTDDLQRHIRSLLSTFGDVASVASAQTAENRVLLSYRTGYAARQMDTTETKR